MNLQNQPIQDQYYHSGTHCFGCGSNNEHGLQIKSYIQDNELVCNWLPHDHHIAYPGYLNGGVIATIMDCHSIGMALIYHYNSNGLEINSPPLVPFVTASLHVDYMKPTPLNGDPVTLKASIIKAENKKIWVKCSLYSNTQQTAVSEVLAVKLEKGFPQPQ